MLQPQSAPATHSNASSSELPAATGHEKSTLASEITIRGNGGAVTLHNQAHIINHTAKPQPAPNHPVCLVTEEPHQEEDNESSDVNIEAFAAFQGDKKLFTRMTDPFNPEWVKEVLRLVTVGEDLTDEERQEVHTLIGSFADIFTLSVSEVKTVDNAVHCLDIPPDATFPTKNH